MGPLHLCFCLSHKKTQYISFFPLYSISFHLTVTPSSPSSLFLFFFLFFSSFFSFFSSSHPHIHGKPYTTTSISHVVTIHESHTHHATIFLFTHGCSSHVRYYSNMLIDVLPQSRRGCCCFAITPTRFLMFYHHHSHHCCSLQPWYLLHYPLNFVGLPSTPPSPCLPFHSSS